MLGSKTAATKQFVSDFDLVTNYYGLRALGEYEDAKQAARRDIEGATIAFASLAAEIRDERVAA